MNESKPSIYKDCKCIIHPEEGDNHDCDKNNCLTTVHFRDGCRCDFSQTEHDNSDCKLCQNERED